MPAATGTLPECRLTSLQVVDASNPKPLPGSPWLTTPTIEHHQQRMGGSANIRITTAVLRPGV